MTQFSSSNSSSVPLWQQTFKTDSFQNTTDAEKASTFNSSDVTSTRKVVLSTNPPAQAIAAVAGAFFAYLVPVGVLLSLFNNVSTIVVLRRRRLMRAMSKTVCEVRINWSLTRSITKY